MKAMATRRQIAELKTFTQIEENQSNSKKFWAAVKKISGGLRNNSCPIPMVQMPTDSSCETDPVTVLKIWRQFGKDSANPGKSDEGRFDEDFKRNTEKKLDTYRALRIFQSHLDAPITNLGRFWTNPKLCWQEDTSKADWKKITYEAAERHEDSSRHSRLARLNSVTSNRYLRIKYWGQTESSFACFVGEIGRRGNLVFEHYLDDRTEKIGSLLKLTCRLGCLPILKRVAREQGLPSRAICKLCDDGNIEDLTHFILFCKGYHKHRTSLFSALGQFLRIESLDYVSTMDLLLGASTGSAFADDRIDFLFKRFLKKSWRTRKWLTIATNSLFYRSDTAWALKSHGDDQQITL